MICEVAILIHTDIYLQTDFLQYEQGNDILRFIINNGMVKYAKEKEYISWSISQTINDMELPPKVFRKIIKEDDEEF